MAIVRIPQEQRTLSDEPASTAYLAGRGIDFERWTPSAQVAQGATADDILAAYDDKIAALKAAGRLCDRRRHRRDRQRRQGSARCSPNSIRSTGTTRTRSA